MFTSILKALLSIPELVATVKELIGWFQRANDEKWFQKSAETFEKLDGPTTTEEKKDAAKNIGDLISKL
jgi:hypothetical protein